MCGVILYGPPASGKDTVTEALHELHPAYSLYPKAKVGRGRTAGYRMITDHDAEHLRQDGAVIWENSRYGATYIVDRGHLRTMLATQVPVVHFGQVEAVRTLQLATPDVHWTVAYLWCPRPIAAQRISSRRTGDTQSRLAAWDATPVFPGGDLVIDTAVTEPTEAAQAIASLAPVPNSFTNPSP